MADNERSVPFGVAGLGVAASLPEASRKRGLLDEGAATEVMVNARSMRKRSPPITLWKLSGKHARILEMYRRCPVGRSRTRTPRPQMGTDPLSASAHRLLQHGGQLQTQPGGSAYGVT
jgi:hypothetical protein